MTKHIDAATLSQIANVADRPFSQPPVDRTFGLPATVYVLYVGAFFAFLAVMATAFGGAELAIPMTIFVAYIAMAFAVPAVWTRIGPDDGQSRLSWDAFRQNGIMTQTGPVGFGAALTQVLIMPVAVLLWGVTVAAIASAY